MVIEKITFFVKKYNQMAAFQINRFPQAKVIFSNLTLIILVIFIYRPSLGWWFELIDARLLLIQSILYSPLDYFTSPASYELLTTSNLTPWVIFSWDIVLLLTFTRLDLLTKLGLIAGAICLVIPLVSLLPVVRVGLLIQRCFFLPIAASLIITTLIF